jgi:hypothetical protein
VIIAMHGLISRDVLDIIQTDANGDMCARDLWKTAQDLFTDNKDDWSIVLLNEFHSLVQGNLAIAAYCKEQKRLADALWDVNSDVNDRVLILNTLRGLSPPISHAASNITMLATLPSFIKVRSMLIFEEMRLDNAAKLLQPRHCTPLWHRHLPAKVLLQWHLIRFYTQLQQQPFQGQGEQQEHQEQGLDATQGWFWFWL